MLHNFVISQPALLKPPLLKFKEKKDKRHKKLMVNAKTVSYEGYKEVFFLYKEQWIEPRYWSLFSMQ